MLLISTDGVIGSVVPECDGCRCKLAVLHDMAMLSYLSIFSCAAHWHMIGLSYACWLACTCHRGTE